MRQDDSAVVAIATHADVAAISVAVVVLAASSIVASLLGVATVVAADSSGRARASGEGRVAAQHGDTRAILGATKGHHVLADVGSDNLTTLSIGVGEDVLNEVVAELVAGNVDKRHARAIRTSLAHDVEVAVKEFGTADLETLLNNLGSELIHAVLCSIAQDMVNSTVAVRKGAVLADVLDAPVAKLTVSDDIDASKNLIDARTLVLVKTVLEDVLDDETASLSQGDFVPHATKSLVDVLHDERRSSAPAQLEQLLPDMACVAVDDRLRDAAQELVDHDGLVLLGHAVKGLLDDMAAESIHAEVQSVATDSLCNQDDLLRRAMLEAALDEEVAETVDHQRIGLVDDSLDDLKLLLRCAKLQLLLKEDGSLLVVAAHNLVNNVAPVAAHVTIEQAAVVERLNGAHIVLALLGNRLLRDGLPLTSEVRGSRRETGADRCLDLLARCSNLRTIDLVQLSLTEVLAESRSGRRCQADCAWPVCGRRTGNTLTVRC
jgi:hypothetical protein